MALGLSWPKIGPPRAWVRLAPGEGAMSPSRIRWAAWQEEILGAPCQVLSCPYRMAVWRGWAPYPF